jgi:hypothetical protein
MVDVAFLPLCGMSTDGVEAAGILRDMDELQLELWMRLLEVPGVEEGENSWGDDTALWVNGTQMANFRRDGGLEIRLTRRVIAELRTRLSSDRRVALRGNSDWAGFRFKTRDDFDFLVEMARRAAKVYLPVDGTAPKPPPSGADMARRKRFH